MSTGKETSTVLTSEQLDRARAVAAVLLPGTADAAPAVALPDLDDLLRRAAHAVEGDDGSLVEALDALPAAPTWESLAAFSAEDPDAFEQVALLALGAYFMAPSVLAALGLPSGERRPADREQAVDELSSGILDAVFERGCPVRTLDDVARAEASA